MWFFDALDKFWHKSPGPVGTPSICGKRWGAMAIDVTMQEPDYGEKCSDCEKGKVSKDG